jgi:phenylacetaldehyde dehydrogenase
MSKASSRPGSYSSTGSGPTPHPARRFRDPNPATARPSPTSPKSDAEDIDRAVQAAPKRSEDGPWADDLPSERIATHLEDRRPHPRARRRARPLESLDNGKPFGVARRGRTAGRGPVFHYMVALGLTRSRATQINISVPYAPGANFPPRCASLGVIGQIVLPWNFR